MKIWDMYSTAPGADGCVASSSAGTQHRTFLVQFDPGMHAGPAVVAEVSMCQQSRAQ